MRIVVMGTPGPQGSKRAFVNRRTGRVVVRESSDKVLPWRQAIVASVPVSVDTPFVGPVSVTGTFYVKRPMSHYRGKSGELRENAPAYPKTRPDLDKYLRSTLDGLTDAGMWLDDSQVVTIDAGKRYVNPEHPTPRAVLYVTEVR